jgi:predicted ATP-grasp superfamily ATP-dependent carboligase
MKVFIVHARRTGYGVIRSLRAFSPTIYIADTFRTPIFHSKYVAKSYIISPITEVDNESFVQKMIGLAEDMGYEEEKPIVFTGKDDYLLFFSKNFPRLSPYFELSFETDYGILEAALNKKSLIRYAVDASVDVPRSFSDDDALSDILEQASWPLVVKPAIKNRPDKDVVAGAFRLKLCHNERELGDAIAQLTAIGQPYVIQEYIPGGDNELYTVGTYSWKGKLKAWSVGKKIRQFPPSTGECSFGMAMCDPSPVDSARRLLEALGLTGISQIEFKKHDGRYYLLEVNPRVWSWHQIHAEVGVNLDKIAIDHVQGSASERLIQPTNDTRYWMFLTMDILHNWMLSRNVSALGLLRDLLRSRIEAFWDLRDPKPFIFHLRRTIKYMRAVSKEHRELKVG